MLIAACVNGQTYISRTETDQALAYSVWEIAHSHWQKQECLLFLFSLSTRNLLGMIKSHHHYGTEINSDKYQA